MKRLSAFALIFSILLTLSACGAADSGTVQPPAPPDGSQEDPPREDDPPQEDAGEDVTVYDCGGVQIALPNRCIGLLTVQTEFSDPDPGWTPLISISETASMEAAEADWGDSDGMGFLFGFGIVDQTLFEQILREGGGTGIEIFAKDEDGRCFAQTFATDVRYYRGDDAPIGGDSEEWKTWEELNALAPEVQADLIARNGLTPYTLDEFYDQPFTYDSEHVYLNYFTGSVFNGTEEYYTLVLSQPVRQGDGGIWCVERMVDQSGHVYVWFPISYDGPAEAYYEALQERCDKGEEKDVLTPLGAARQFVKESNWFLQDAAPEDFRETEKPAVLN